jgi:galactokinase
VNLIGEHTDYNAGFVLPLAIDRSCVIAARPAKTVRVRSLDAVGELKIPADGSVDPSAVDPPWGRYVAGVVRELAIRGRPDTGIDAVVSSDVPLGAGLSSSAALEVASALGLQSVADWELAPHDLAEACRAAEETATGVPCGIMDQLVSIEGVDGAALLVDCRSLEVREVPLPADLAVLAVHSGVSRGLADSGYAERRRACEAVARRLGLESLRDATLEQVADEPVGRHVVTENERVLEAATALAEDDRARLGELFAASHASMRDDFRISTPELDVLVDELVEAGAVGARLTGGGFGGSVVAVCDHERADAIAETATRRYRERTGRVPTAFLCRAVAGAGPFP